MNLLRSQTAVDLEAGNKNDENKESTTVYTDCIPQFIVPEGHNGQEQAKSPDESEH